MPLISRTLTSRKGISDLENELVNLIVGCRLFKYVMDSCDLSSPSDLDILDVDPHLVRWIAAFLTNRNQRVRVGEALPPPIWLNGGTPQGTKLAPLLFCILVNRMASNCTNRVKYVDDATVMEFVPRLSPSYLNFTVSDIYSFASSRGMVLNGKKMQGNVH